MQQIHKKSLSIGEVTYLGISSFDVVKCALWQFDQLCVSHSMDSGGSWLSGQGLHLKHITGHVCHPRNYLHTLNSKSTEGTIAMRSKLKKK